MGPVQTTYAFTDLTGVLANPVMGSPLQIVGGNVGLGTITIRMLTERSEMDTGADGVVMPSYVAGKSAEVTIEVQQTSMLHHALLNLFNLLSTAADGGDLSNVAATVISLRTILDGSGHFLSGVMFAKIPDKPYAPKGGNVTWSFKCALAENQ